MKLLKGQSNSGAIWYAVKYDPFDHQGNIYGSTCKFIFVPYFFGDRFDLISKNLAPMEEKDMREVSWLELAVVYGLSQTEVEERVMKLYGC